jgi:hypothetical protein
MAEEMLAIPEASVVEVIRVIRLGLNRANHMNVPVSDQTARVLNEWCRKQDNFLKLTKQEKPK